MKLAGKSRKGKNRIHELGDEWVLIKTADKVGFTSEPGPWLCIEPITNSDKGRWIHGVNDADFTILEK